MKTFIYNNKILLKIKNEKKNKFLIKFLLLLIIIIYMIIFKININNIFNNKRKNNIKNLYFNPILFNKYYLFKLINNYGDKNHYFNITYFDYSYSFKYNIIKIEYNIGFYDKNNNLIIPSDLSLYNNLHIFCHVDKNKNYSYIESLANINNNKYYKCIEFFNINDIFKLGINLKSQKYNKFYIIDLFDSKIINYNKFNNNNLEFNPLIINQKFKSLIQKMHTLNETNDNFKLTKLFIQLPKCSSKIEAIIDNNNWEFINLYNHYFCSCKGSKCIYNRITQICKFYFYLTIIDNNKNIYNKTDYLLADFIYANYSSDDVYPIFEQMIKLNMSAHYMTEKIDIYNKYCKNKNNCLSIILVNKTNRIINGDFLEKYLTLFLKLKATISGAKFLYIENLFYHIDYITHICVGHGISILKQFLYSGHKYYGHKRYNKILLPPSDKIISVAKKYGWKDENIIKINLPKWDKYNNNLYPIQGAIKKNSIFIMFTWRQMKKDKKISIHYINNILKLINNNELIKALTKKNITLYFTVHHKVRRLKKKFKTSKYIEYIIENDIFECLSKTNLVVTDFSSIIFDMICRKKPYVIYIPDANDPQIKKIYKNNYFKTIKFLKKKSFNFLNKYFELDEAIKKIIYYINNDFKLEKKMEKFYRSFSFDNGNNTQKFIEYLKKLKEY